MQLKSCLFRNPLSSASTWKKCWWTLNLHRSKILVAGFVRRGSVVHRRRGWTVCLSWIEINSRTRADWWDVYRRHFDNKRAILAAATPILPITIRHISTRLWREGFFNVKQGRLGKKTHKSRSQVIGSGVAILVRFAGSNYQTSNPHCTGQPLPPYHW